MGQGREGLGKGRGGAGSPQPPQRPAGPQSVLGGGSTLATPPRARARHRLTFGSEQRGIAGLVAEGLPVVLGREGQGVRAAPRPGSLAPLPARGRAHLGMAPGRQRLAAVFAPEAESVPVLAQGAHLLSWDRRAGQGQRPAALRSSAAAAPLSSPRPQPWHTRATLSASGPALPQGLGHLPPGPGPGPCGLHVPRSGSLRPWRSHLALRPTPASSHVAPPIRP